MTQGEWRTAFVFAGQGSQYFGMGGALYDREPAFARSLDELGVMFADHGLERLVPRLLGTDGDRPSTPMTDIRLSHTGIVAVELALAAALRLEGVEPDLLIGSSLGEFAALVVGGGLVVEDLVRVLASHVRLLQDQCPRGGMLAVLADPTCFQDGGIDWGGLEMAALNSASHFVVAGTEPDVRRVSGALQRRHIMCEVLPVEFPFHSSLIDPIRDDFLRGMAALDIKSSQVPLISCATAGAVEASATHFWDVIRAPIRWQATLAAVEATYGPKLRYLDLSPSGSMHGLVRAHLGPAAESRSAALSGPFVPRRSIAQTVALVGLQAIPTAKGNGMTTQVPAPTKRSPEAETAVLFPGQGSQHKGMGRDLFSRYAPLVEQARDVLGFAIDDLCLEDRDGRLKQTEFAQPALFIVDCLSWHHLVDTAAVDPHRAVLAGHSLGEFAALYAAGMLSFADGLGLVRRRGELMAQATGGGMAAVVGLSQDVVVDILRSDGLADIDLANINSHEQLVISGLRERVLAAETSFTRRGARFVPLNVSGAFHSRHMQRAVPQFQRALSEVTFRAGQIPVLSNVTGTFYGDSDPRELLAAQLVSPVQWASILGLINGLGVTEVREAGPGRVLTALARATSAAKQPPVPSRTKGSLSEHRTGAPATLVPGRGPNAVAASEGAGHPSGSLGPRPDRGARALGSQQFRDAYGVELSYVCGGMYRGIASEALVRRAAQNGVLAFYGAGGLAPAEVKEAVARLQSTLGDDQPFGLNVVHDPTGGDGEDALIDICIAHGIRQIEASAFIKISPALVRYRLAGLRRGQDGQVKADHRIMAKLSRPEVAAEFLAPPTRSVVDELVRRGLVTPEQALLASEVPVADDICAEGDSGGHTDRRNPLVLYPSIVAERDRAVRRHGYQRTVRIGVAGGIGTPQAAAAAFAMGADFVTTGSINVCSVESGMSEHVKDLIQDINIQDTDYAPAGDMFELGAQVQVLRKGVFFPARARKLFELYRAHGSLDDLPEDVRAFLEKKYFGRPLAAVWQETRSYFQARDPEQVHRAEVEPRHKMALVFRWYFAHSMEAALQGREADKLDYQVHCGPALGAFNQWARDTPLASWRQRHVDDMAWQLMDGAALILRDGARSGAR